MLRDAGRAEWAAAWALPRPPQGAVTSLCLAALPSEPHSSASQGRGPVVPPVASRVRCPRGVPPTPCRVPVARPAPGSPMHTFSSSSSAEPLR